MHKSAILSAAGIAAAVAAIGCGGGGGGEEQPAKPAGPRALSPEQLVQQAGPSVVKLFGKQFDGTSSGSGVVIDAKRNLVLTNAHVVQGLSALKAVTNDGSETPARVIGAAPCDDLAVVELPRASGLRALPFARGPVKPGQHVTALGYPGTAEEQSGEQGPGSTNLTFTDGRVSQAETTATVDTGYKLASAIQHQAPINPGNSGGPLVDDFGKLVGINSAGGGEDQAYAVTAELAQKLVPDLAEGKGINDLGWNISPYDSSIVEAMFVDKPSVGAKLASAIEDAGEDEGVLVIGSDPDSPAEKAELVFGDFVTEMDDTPISSPADVCDVLDSATPGSTVRVNGYYLASAPSPDQRGERWKTDLKIPKAE